jgi:hypothetical protein
MMLDNVNRKQSYDIFAFDYLETRHFCSESS